MTLVAVNPFALWDDITPDTASFSNLLLDAANEKAAWIIQAPKTGTIDRVCFRTNTVTTGETVDVRVETLDASGLPSGTLFGTNTNASQLILLTDDNTWFEATLTAGASVTRGDLLAVVVAMPGVTTGNLNIARCITNVIAGIPLTLLYTGTWAEQTARPIGAIRYSDATYPMVPGLVSFTTVNVNNYSTTSTPDEIGNKITVPFACKVAGVWHRTSGTAAGDYTLKLYDNSGSVAASKAFDGDAGSFGAGAFLYSYLDAEVTLAAGDVVRVTKLPTTTTNTSLLDVVAPTGLGSALPGGTATVLTSRSDAGAWTNTSDRQACIGLIISALDDGNDGGRGAVIVSNSAVY